MWIFPKYALGRAPFGPSAYLKQNSEYFPANNSLSDDKSLRQRQHRQSAAVAQHKAHAAIATLNPATASRFACHEPKVINLRVCTTPPATLAVVRGIPLSWSGIASTNHVLLEKEPSFIYEDRAHAAHNTPQHKTKTTQRNTPTTSKPNRQPNYSTTSRWKSAHEISPIPACSAVRELGL